MPIQTASNVYVPFRSLGYLNYLRTYAKNHVCSLFSALGAEKERIKKWKHRSAED